MSFFEQFRLLSIGQPFVMFGDRMVFIKVGVKRAKLMSDNDFEFEVSEHTIGELKTVLI